MTFDSKKWWGIDMLKPNVVMKIVMLPFIVSAFLIGWCLSWSGPKKKLQTKSPSSTFYSGRLRTSYAYKNNVVFLNSINKQNFEPRHKKSNYLLG